MTGNTAVLHQFFEPGSIGDPDECTDSDAAEERLTAPFVAVPEVGSSRGKSSGAWTNFTPSGSEEASPTAGGTRAVTPPAYLRRPQAGPRAHFIPLEKREGVVLEIGDEEFEARLVDILGEEPDVTATFSFSDLSDDGLRLLKVGAVFYWNVGYSVSPFGQRSRVADLVFRRLPARSSSDVASAIKRAEQIRDELGLDN